MSSRVAHAGGHFAADEDGGGAHGDGIGRADADAHVADGGGGEEADEDGRNAGAADGAADVGNRRRARCDHRAGVHVSETGGRFSHGKIDQRIRQKEQELVFCMMAILSDVERSVNIYTRTSILRASWLVTILAGGDLTRRRKAAKVSRAFQDFAALRLGVRPKGFTIRADAEYGVARGG
jgi:hypothetical protein